MSFRFHSRPLLFCAAQRQARGFSLLEILVSIIVLSFGLLGVVGLQAAALQSNRDARLQSVATQYVRDLTEIAASNYKELNGMAASSNPLVMSFSAVRDTTPKDCLAAACTSQEFVESQIDGWKRRISADTGAESLPKVRVVTCYDLKPFDTSTGLPTWDCTSGGGQLVAKIGWSRQSTRSGAQDTASSVSLATGTGSRPQIVLPITQ